MHTKIYKFGGASVKDADGFRNVGRLVGQALEDQGLHPLVVVVSAIGKTTNALERLTQLAASDLASAFEGLNQIAEDHIVIASQILSQNGFRSFKDEAKAITEAVAIALQRNWAPDRLYDTVVSAGELWSSALLHTFLLENHPDITSHRLKASRLVHTDSSFRNPEVDEAKTYSTVYATVQQIGARLYVTQGFLGGTTDGQITTLGREGSDYSAALMGRALQAQSVTIWKDVEGVLSADPKRFAFAKLLPAISYRLAAEMTYYGSQVIHPKTIKPLAEVGIPLVVRSFIYPTGTGTIVSSQEEDTSTNIVIRKDGCLLLTLAKAGLQFLKELDIALILQLLHKAGAQIYMIQTGAISVTLILNIDIDRNEGLFEELMGTYQMQASKAVSLFTFINCEDDLIEKQLQGHIVVLDQRIGSRKLVAAVV